MEAFFLEKYNVAMGLVPVDLNAGANTGLRVSMKGQKRLIFLVTMADSTAAVVNFTLNQHDASTSGNSKALSIANPYYVKAAAATVWTKVVPGSAASNYVLSTTFSDDPGMVAFEVLAEDLDVENNYAWVSLSALDTTAAKVGAILVLADSNAKPAYALDLAAT